MQRRSIPFVCPDVPGTGGSLKKNVDDFIVEELPLYTPSGDGDHTYLWVEKRDLAAFEMTRRIARFYKVKQSEVGTAGLKDRRAVTRQWVSIPTPKRPVEVGPIDEQLQVLEHDLHTNKLKTGHLVGNRFTIRVTDLLDLDRAFESASLIASFYQEHGIPNFYGPQRFGRGDETLSLGLRLLAGEEVTRDKRLKRLALSAVQSAIFNETLIERHARGALFKTIAGDILAKVDDGGARRVAPGEEEGANVRVANRSAVPTGPMWGPKMTVPDHDLGEIERMVLERSGVAEAAFSIFKKLTRGSRRPILVYSDDPIVVTREEDALQIRFCLPAGAYATVPLNELMKTEGEPE